MTGRFRERFRAHRSVPWFAGLALLALAGSARADFVSVLQPDPIVAATSVAFANSNVTVGTLSSDGQRNFLDQWQFTLDGSFQVSTIATSIAFTDGNGQSVLLGVTNLQVNLVSNPLSGPPIVSWVTVSPPVNGLEETVALIPPTPLGAGNYTLEVRGFVTQPGSYAGSMIVRPPAPVPVPAPALLFGSGLAALGLVGWRRRTNMFQDVRGGLAVC